MSKRPQLAVHDSFKKKLTAEQKVRLKKLIYDFSQLGETLNINHGYHDSLYQQENFNNPNQLQWVNYVEQFALTVDDLPILAVMIGSDKLHFAKDENKFFVALHSACAISDLQQIGSEVLLINEIYRYQLHDNGWIGELYPFYLAKFGDSVLETIKIALNQTTEPFTKGALAEVFELVAKQQQSNQMLAIQYLVEQLQNFAEQSSIYNAILIGYLVELKQTEQLPLIKQVFDSNKADIDLYGNYADIEIELGLKTVSDMISTH